MKKALNKDAKKPMKFLDCRVEWDVKQIKSVDGSIFIEGYANTVDKDRVGDVVIPEAFQKTLPSYMENPVLLFQHDWDKIIGTVVSAEVTDKGLYIKAKLSAAKDVEDVKTKILEGSLRTFSIGYNEVDAVFDERTKTNIIKELELLEISVVTIPANANAKFTVVQEEKVDGDQDVEKTLETMPESFLTFLAENVKELEEGEEITVEFLKELFEVWKLLSDAADVDTSNVKFFQTEKKKEFTEVEQEHLRKVMESAQDAATECMKLLSKAHDSHMKAYGSDKCQEHMKAMDAYCRSMDEAERATKAYKQSAAKGDQKKDDQKPQDDVVEWHSYSRRGSDDEGYAEDEDKGGPGSGRRGHGGGTPAEEGERAARQDAQRQLKRLDNLQKSRESMAKFVKQSNAVKSGIARVKANKAWNDHIKSLQEARRASRSGKSLVKELDLVSADVLDKVADFISKNPELDDAKLELFSEETGVPAEKMYDAFAQLYLESEAIAEVDSEE